MNLVEIKKMIGADKVFCFGHSSMFTRQYQKLILQLDNCKIPYVVIREDGCDKIKINVNNILHFQIDGWHGHGAEINGFFLVSIGYKSKIVPIHEKENTLLGLKENLFSFKD